MVEIAQTAVRSSLPAIFFTDEVKPEFPSIFMYAIAGAGKTYALSTLKEFNPLVIATEDGQTKGMGTLGGLHIAAVPINNLDQIVMVTAELQATAKKGELKYGGHTFNALVLDSFTGVGPMLEEASMKMKGWTSIWGDVTPGGRKDPRTAYPYIAEKGRQVARKLMALPVPLVITCREQVITEEEGAAAKSYPAPELPGQKLPKEVSGWLEATVRLRMVNGKRVFQTVNQGDVVARVRLQEGWRLDDYCQPNLGALIKVLQGDEAALKALKLT